MFDKKEIEEIEKIKKEICEFREFLHKIYDTKTEPCIYCGVPAIEKEHVVPLSYLENLKDLKLLGIEIEIPEQQIVHSCRECNLLLGYKFVGELKKRKEFLKIRLAEKYKKLLKSPDWNDDEIAELDGRLRENIIIIQEF